jgi:hypothetical protein
VNSLFCRHNRFTADCPICSKGTVLDPNRQASRPRSSSSGSSRPRSAAAQKPARYVTGPYASAGPYEDERGDSYEVRIEKVPGGVRLASWAGGSIERRAPVLLATDLPGLVGGARERELLGPRDVEALERALACDPAESEAAEFGASPGRAGDLREELRVEAVGGGEVRVARWVYRPGEAAWDLQDAPVMLPAQRFAEALRAAARGGVLVRAAAGA